MKDIYKNPIFYYILVPAVLALWPLSIALIYLPRAEKQLTDDARIYKEAREQMLKILALDSDRIENPDQRITTEQFDYNKTVARVANKYNISDRMYKVSTKPPRVLRGQRSQNATVTLKNVDIASTSKFLSDYLLSWPDLQCENISLQKIKQTKNSWDVDFTFRYFF